MLQAELDIRVPQALADEEGPWKLLGYLDEVQTPINYEGVFYPSYTLHLLIEDLRQRLPAKDLSAEQLTAALISIADSALEAEKQHLLRATREMLDRTEESLDRQRQERTESIDTFLEGQRIGSEEEGVQAPRPQDLLVELSSLVRTPLKLNNEQMRALAEGDEEAGELVRDQVEDSLLSITSARVVGTMQRRLEEFPLKAGDLQGRDWPDLVEDVLDAVETVFDQRKQTLMGDQGQLNRDITPYLEKMNLEDLSDRDLMILLMLIAQGTRLAFDSRTHRKGYERYQRLNYVYLAAQLLGGRDPQDVER
jgi:preprotein translocase subunit SecA